MHSYAHGALNTVIYTRISGASVFVYLYHAQYSYAHAAVLNVLYTANNTYQHQQLRNRTPHGKESTRQPYMSTVPIKQCFTVIAAELFMSPIHLRSRSN